MINLTEKQHVALRFLYEHEEWKEGRIPFSGTLPSLRKRGLVRSMRQGESIRYEGTNYTLWAITPGGCDFIESMEAQL